MIPLKTETRRYECLVCGYIYHEQLGCPEKNILPGTRWEDIPLAWRCPECDAVKEDFQMLEELGPHFSQYDNSDE